MHKATQQLAENIASKSPVAIHTNKKSILYSRDHSVAEGMDHIALLNGAMLQTSDTKTAVMAIMAKTKPVFAKL
jgi:enoyl-CoA hydratase/carnithine racemase